MNFIRLIPLCFFTFFFGTVGFAQEKPSKEYRESLLGKLEEMQVDQQKSLVIFALQRAEIDAEKYLKKIIKTMSEDDRQRLLILAESGSQFDPKRTKHPGRKEIKGSSNSLNRAITSVGLDQQSHDFGLILQGSEVKHIFTITNTGVDNLEISSIKSNCGCIIPKWPQKPVAPGESVKLEVIFNTLALSGKQEHTLSMIANTAPKETTFTIKASVQSK